MSSRTFRFVPGRTKEDPHRRIATHGESHCESQGAQDPAEVGAAQQSPKPGAGRSLHSGVSRHLRGEQVGYGGGNRLSFVVEASRDRVADPKRRLIHDQVQHWTRRVLSLQEDLWKAVRGQHLQVWLACALQAERSSFESGRTSMGARRLDWQAGID